MKTILISLLLIVAITAAPRDAPGCQSSDGKGLPDSLSDVSKLIEPHIADILDLFLVAVTNDPEVSATMDYIGSDDFVALIQKLHGTDELYKVLEKSCSSLYLDAEFILNSAGDILGWPSIPKRPSARMSPRRRPGLKGLIEDIMELLPIQTIGDIMLQKLNSDEYVKQGVELLRSDDFIVLVKTVTETNQYKYIIEKLTAYGLDVETAKTLLRLFLGWPV